MKKKILITLLCSVLANAGVFVESSYNLLDISSKKLNEANLEILTPKKLNQVITSVGAEYKTPVFSKNNHSLTLGVGGQYDYAHTFVSYEVVEKSDEIKKLENEYNLKNNELKEKKKEYEVADAKYNEWDYSYKVANNRAIDLDKKAKRLQYNLNTLNVKLREAKEVVLDYDTPEKVEELAQEIKELEKEADRLKNEQDNLEFLLELFPGNPTFEAEYQKTHDEFVQTLAKKMQLDNKHTIALKGQDGVDQLEEEIYQMDREKYRATENAASYSAKKSELKAERKAAMIEKNAIDDEIYDLETQLEGIDISPLNEYNQRENVARLNNILQKNSISLHGGSFYTTVGYRYNISKDMTFDINAHLGVSLLENPIYKTAKQFEKEEEIINETTYVTPEKVEKISVKPLAKLGIGLTVNRFSVEAFAGYGNSIAGLKLGYGF